MSLKSRQKCFGSLIILVLFACLRLTATAQAEGGYDFVAQIGDYGTFQFPCGVAVDVNGNIYIADSRSVSPNLGSIQKFDSNGVYLTQWTTRTDGGDINHPVGVAVDSISNVYVVYSGVYWDNQVAQKFDSNGNTLIKLGGGTGDGQFSKPNGIAVDNRGNVYVVDYWLHRVQKFDSNGGYITQWGSRGTGKGQFDGPFNVAADSIGNVYVTDRSNSRVQKFDSNGGYITQWGSNGTGKGQFGDPLGIAVDSKDNVYVADWGNGRIQKFDNNGGYITEWSSNDSNYITVDSSGFVYATVYDSGFVKKFAPTVTTRIINISPSSLAFGDVIVSKTKQLTMTVQNTGNSTLTVSSVSYPAGFSGNWIGGTIAAGGSQPITVTFSPSAVQSYTGTVTVSSDKTAGTDTIAISGSGIADPCQCTDTNGSTQQGIDLVKNNPGGYQLLTQAQSDQAVKAEQLKWDANGDGKIGLEDIIRMLQVIAGLRP